MAGNTGRDHGPFEDSHRVGAPRNDERRQDNDPQPCPPLELPAELRNAIWEQAFIVEASTTKDLFVAEPLPVSILLTCHKIHGETSAMYKRAKSAYLSQSAFVQSETSRHEALAKLPLLSESHIRRITSLKLYAPRGDELTDGDGVHYRHGLWHVIDGGNTATPLLIMPVKGRMTPAEADLVERKGMAWRMFRPVKGMTWNVYQCTEISNSDQVAVESGARRRALSLWELEGAIRAHFRALGRDAQQRCQVQAAVDY
ncbi:hypothetical protein LTR53_011636 [Teratosphaeriaceae sp. CCFEE 6253]|nr:hypothetical protein LTR53_011636 [Teratosphaeriaceae sp. CCFEE 6253]